MKGLERKPDVVATELEEGAVLLDMGTGFYYSLNEPAAEIWRALDAVSGAGELAERLAARFEVDPERAGASAGAFVAELERASLVVQGNGAAPQAAAPPAAAGNGRLPFSEPELVKHDEPLHEVSMSPFDPQLPLAE